MLAALSAAFPTPIKAQDGALDGTSPPSPESAPALAEADAGGTASEAGTPEQAIPAPVTTPKEKPSFWNRSTFSGDWWGARTDLAKSGVNLRLWATGFYQGQWSGDVGSVSAADGRGTEFLSGGRLDALIDLDTTKLGLWRGGGFHVHLELEGGRVPGFRGGALWPVNSGAILPLAALSNWRLRRCTTASAGVAPVCWSARSMPSTCSRTIRSSAAGGSIAS